MENLDTGKDKIKKICEILQNETIQPAQEEAQKILDTAEQESRNIIKDAESRAENIIKAAKEQVAKERELFDASIRQACRQGIELLKQDIENKLFNDEIVSWLGKEKVDPELTAKLINALVSAVEKEGISADFSALIPPQIPADRVNAFLVKRILEKLREKSVVVGEFMGGVQLKLHDKRLTLDLSDEALKELIGQYIRKDFRELLFKA